jgi:hypothetical protein
MSGVKMGSVWAAVVVAGVIGCGGTAGAEAASGDAAEGAAVRSASPCRQAVPARLTAPIGEELELGLGAVGVQIYTCTATATGAAWVFTAPEATLYADDGKAVVHHYAGPTWEAKDGSTVVAARVDGVTVDATAIPWLLLKAVSHSGDGRLTEVSSIQRIATTGGLPPAAASCSAATLGAVAEVPYTATYCFYEKEDEEAVGSPGE